MKPTRRRFICISASVIGVGILHASGVQAAVQSSKLYEWHGVAMGASAQISLYAHSETQANNLFQKCENEITRVENLFSLFKPNSQISQLNANGELPNPNFEFVELLSRCKSYAQITKGAFDVTIQPLWKLYENHFANSSAELPMQALNDTLELIGSDGIQLNANKILFSKPKMAISLNGVAQGYLTDKITNILQQAGFENMLVHMGETYGFGQHDDGRQWRVGILSPQNRGEIVKQVELKNQAIATSGGYGSPFSKGGHHHLLNPKTGLSANVYASVSVVAEDALTADMLSTAFYIMQMDQIEAIWNKFPQLKKAIFIDFNGDIIEKQA
ncbi:MAG: FAD:protein FMN transferase [Rhizobiales bacterium]|nr:FAD:protein FMN transferase [Hyphomicrobiales bacterium]NRB14482.1 FAD:protein FMN transferase [Hyphomicrobiales bacterium]